MMEQEKNSPELDEFQREDRCRKALKNVGKAIFMRLLVVVLIVWAFTRTALKGWLIGLMLFVIVITLSALPPLLKEWKARRKELNEIMDSEE